jgi:hypothetical protein
MHDPLRLVSAVSAMFAAVEGDADSEKNIEQRARFYRTIPELDFPEDWDVLPLEEKKIRLDRLDKIGLQQEEE